MLPSSAMVDSMDSMAVERDCMYVSYKRESVSEWTKQRSGVDFVGGVMAQAWEGVSHDSSENEKKTHLLLDQLHLLIVASHSNPALSSIPINIQSQEVLSFLVSPFRT